jgi:hypothetical protein
MGTHNENHYCVFAAACFFCRHTCMPARGVCEAVMRATKGAYPEAVFDRCASAFGAAAVFGRLDTHPAMRPGSGK